MAIFLTGSTGYVGAHVAALLLEQHPDHLNLLVRAKDVRAAEQRLWQSLQLHLDFPRFHEYLQTRISIFCGDLTSTQFGLNDADYERLVSTTDSIIHCAASLNRKSEKVCLNTNLRGTLEVLKLARAAQDQHGLRRFSDVSTVAVAGHRSNEAVGEDESIDWNRSDYDPYARTKKFCEHMVNELLPDVPHTVFRPSIILGDSRRAETTQFDMVRSFVFLAGLPVLPFRPTDKIDIVNVDFVAESIVTIHQKEKPLHNIYHLSSGTGSQTFKELTDALSQARGKGGPIYLPALEKPFASVNNWLADNMRGNAIGFGATLLKVFIPYLVWNTVFDNTRICRETDKQPAPFSAYSYPLLKFSKAGNFTYPYKEWPHNVGQAASLSASVA
ncbi:MAG: SDR family oxidoreductase [Acidobacteria bacterium]|nr:SDR family oxidoreductase [Acidobacteriota bacterium]MBI3421431.1 SDR family oxidoreductase [Acidobacteriota bacterium]